MEIIFLLLMRSSVTVDSASILISAEAEDDIYSALHRRAGTDSP